MYKETNTNILTVRVFNFMKRNLHEEARHLWGLTSQHLNRFSFSVFQFACHPYWEVWQASGCLPPV
jgi:hypothetical protein